MAYDSAWENYKEQVRRATDLVQLVQGFVQLKKSGKTWSARCPFHNETAPSFHVYPDKQYWRCYGACNEGGDVFDFLMKMEGLEFREALTRLGQAAGIQEPARSATESAEAQQARRDKEDFYRFHAEAAAFYRNLYLGPGGVAARGYAERRGVSGELATDFNLGYAPDAGAALIEHFRANKVPEQTLARAGLAIEREGGGCFDRFRHRLRQRAGIPDTARTSVPHGIKTKLLQIRSKARVVQIFRNYF